MLEEFHTANSQRIVSRAGQPSRPQSPVFGLSVRHVLRYAAELMIARRGFGVTALCLLRHHKPACMIPVMLQFF
jgi:hypothetical protein